MLRNISSNLGGYGCATLAVMLVAIMVLLSQGSAFGATTASFQAEKMSLPSGSGQVFNDSNASGGKALLIWSNATATKTTKISGPADEIRVRVRGDQCDGSPRMTVKVDGKQVLRAWVWQTKYTIYKAPVSLAAGSHTVEVSMDNDYSTNTCDRNLRVDVVRFFGSEAEPEPEPEPEPVVSDNPFADATAYIAPYSSAKRQAEEWRDSRPADAEQMDKIANAPQADWFGDWSGDIQSAVAQRVTTITDAGALPVLVAYNIPIRDCGSYSSGGAPSAAEYRAWIDAFAAGVGGRQAVVILEPDALAMMHCLSAEQTQERYDLLGYAVNALNAQGAVVYLDAGHSNWHSASEMANRLSKANVAAARGFALNVSNFEYTSNVVGYAKDVSSRIGGKPFVVDTSRNGNGPGETWCNPSGRALGEKPTSVTGDPLVDAYLWIKPPGESDGACNGGPPAGQWWPEYALGLAQRAAY